MVNVRAILVLVVLAAGASRVRADEPCRAEADAARKAPIDPSLARPTDPAALKLMKAGGAHNDEARKRLDVVATRDQAGAEFQAAIDAYAAAATIEAAPVLLYNLAHTYRSAGDYPNAIDQYRSFVARGKPGPVLRALVECHIATMSTELENAAASAPPSEPAGAEAPTPIDVRPIAKRRSRTDVLGWALVGGGVAVAGAGVGLLVNAGQLKEDASAEPRDDVRTDLRAKEDRFRTWGTVTTIAGGAVLVAGIVKLAIRPGAPPDDGLSLRLSPNGVAIGGRF